DITGSGLVSGATVNLHSTSGNIGTGTGGRVFTAASSTLTAIASGDAYVSQDGSVNLGNSSAGGTFDLVTTSNGSLTISGTAGVAATTLNLTAGGTGSILQSGAGSLSGATVDLTAGGTLGTDPNASGTRLNTAATGTLELTADSAWINQSGAVALSAAND